MKKHFRLLAVVTILITGSSSFGQIAGGTYSIPGAAYPTIAAAVDSLNNDGISGAVIFNCAGGGGETAPSGGILLGSATLNNSVSGSNTITFNTLGSGGDYLITAQIGTGSSDFIFAIQGTDYVTINGIDLVDNNSTPTTEMEYGYAFFNLNASAPFDGCQYDEIENCTITLNNSNTNVANVNGTEGASGIFAEQAVYNNATTPLTPIAAGDLFSNNKFYGNTVQDVTNGIYLVGSNALPDQSNDIGGSSTATRNTIQNLALPGGANALYGVFATGQNNLNVSYNSINNTAGGGSPAAGLAVGIEVNGNTGVFTVNNNSIALTLTEALITGEPYSNGIYAPTTGTLTADNDTITMVENKDTYNGSIGTSSGVMNGILTYTLNDTLTNLTATGNIINILQMDTAPVYGFNVSVSTTGTASITITGNTVTEKCAYTTTATYSVVLGNDDTTYTQISTPYLYGIGAFSGAGAANISNNTVFLSDSTYAYAYGIYTGTTGTTTIGTNSVKIDVTMQTYTGGSTTTTLHGVNTYARTETAPSGYIFFIFAGGSGTAESITNNSFSSDSLNSTTNQYLIADGWALVSNQTLSKTISGNYTSGTIRRHRVGSTGIFYGYYNGGPQTIGGANYITYNNFSNITFDSSGQFIGIASSTGSPVAGAQSVFITGNIISNIREAGLDGGGPLTGLEIGGAQFLTVDSNTVSGLNSGITSGVNGLTMGQPSGSANSVWNIYENTFNNISNTDQPQGAVLFGLNPTINFYRNKIYDINNTASGADTSSGANGISVSGEGSSSAVDTLNIYNNAIDSISAPIYTYRSFPEPLVNGILLSQGLGSASQFVVHIYDNSIVMNGSAGPGYKSAGVYYGAGATATKSYELLMQNNIIINNMPVNGSSIASDIWAQIYPGPMSGYQAGSNNNMLYAGTPGANNVIFNDGTNSEQTLADYESFLASNYLGQDAASQTEANMPFMSISGSSANFLKLDTTGTICYNHGIVVPVDANDPGNNIDYFGIIRAGNSGYTGNATYPTIGASEIIVTGNQPLQAQATATNSSCSACAGTATVSASRGAPPYHYLWAPNGDTTASIENLCVGIYYVTVTDSLGATVTDTAVVAATTSLTVNLGNDTSICSGQSLVLNAGNAGADYLWNSTANSATTQTVPASTAGNYAVTVSMNGCTGTDSVLIGIDTLPAITVTSNKSTICSDDSAQICAPGGYPAYLWNTNDTTNCIYAHSAGNYYVTVTNGYGCSAQSNQLPISVFESSSVGTTQRNDTLTASGGVAYQWYLNGTLLANDTTSVIVATSPGSYTVQVIDSNGCSATSNPLTYTGILNIQDDMFEIYPNPTSVSLRVSGTGDLMGKTLEIYDATGRLVYTSKITQQVTDIDVSKFASDVYLVKVDTGVKMFIKQ